MSDVTYSVVVDLSTKGNLGSSVDGLGNKLGALEGKIGGIGDGISGLGMKLADAFANAASKAADVVTGIAKIGAIAGMGAAAYGVAKLNNELEKTQISLAAIFNKNGVGGTFEQSMSMGADAMAQMRKDASALPGETKDLVGIFKDISVPGFQSGANVDQLRKLSSQTMATSAVMGLPFEQAGREMAMLLEGRAGAHNVLGMRLAGLGGDAAEHFNKMSGEDRMKFLAQELGKFDPAIKAFQNSFEGLSTSFLDNVHKFGSEATKPLFEKVKDVLRDANQWFDDHKERIASFAETIGYRLASAFDMAVTAAKKLEPYLAKLASYLENGDVGGDLKKLAVGTLAAKAMPGVLGAANGIGGALAMGGGAEGGAALGLGALGVSLPIIALGAIAAAGALDVLSDKTNAFHDVAAEAWDQTVDHAQTSADLLGKAWDAVAPAAQTLADVIGTVTLGQLDALSYAVEGLSAAVSFAAGAAKDAADGIIAAFGVVAKIKGDIGSPVEHMFDNALKKLGAETAKEVWQGPVNYDHRKMGAGGGHGGTHIDKVEITVSSNQDPSRIARMTHAELANLARHPRVSRYVTNWSANRV